MSIGKPTVIRACVAFAPGHTAVAQADMLFMLGALEAAFGPLLTEAELIRRDATLLNDEFGREGIFISTPAWDRFHAALVDISREGW